MIRCPQCGYENALGHIFCERCRSKLDIQALESNAFKEPADRRRRSGGWRLVWLALGVGIAAGVLLALWPMPLAGDQGAESDAQQARKKMLLLEKGLSPAAQLFTEREINAYLGQMLSNIHDPRFRGVWQNLPQAVKVVIRPNAVTITVASVRGPITIGMFKLGPWNVTSQVTLVPERGPRGVDQYSAGFQWKISSGRIGHLPLPGPVSAPAGAGMRPLLEAGLRERALLARVNYLELEDGRVTVAVRNRVWQSL